MWIRILTYSWLILTLFLLLKPGTGYEQVVFFKHEDKVAHFGLFFNLTILWLHEIRIDFGLSEKMTFLLTFIMGVILAGGTEFLQQFIPYRGMDLDDFLVDVLAVTVGIIFAYWLQKKNRRLAKSD